MAVGSAKKRSAEGGAKQKQKTGSMKARVKAKTGAKGGVNPFDVRGNAKTKYEVLGRRVKGAGRNVAVARADAEAKRKKTLAAQFKQRNKANAFQDRRLGETDPEMSLEDKMMARFQTERKRKMRNAQAFALQDSEDENEDAEELFLTHKGQKIDDYDKLNAGDPSAFDDGEDDEETRKMEREIVDKLHFGGGNGGNEDATDGPERKKSHKEIMQEVMMKSKLFKAERQKNKAAQEDATDALDSEFASLKGLLSFRPTKGSKEAAALEKQEKKDTPMDEFDKLTRELTFEAKAQASERRMSPEEMAKREHDRLQELERKRVARMNGEEEDSDEEGGKKKNKKKKVPQMIIMPPTDDDLAADYQVDQRFGAVGDEGEGDGNEEDGEGEEEDGDEEDDSEAGSDDEEGDEDDEGEGEEDEEEEEEEESAEAEEEEQEDGEADEDAAAKKAERKRKRQEAAEELPFVFPCPESPEELADLFKEHAHNSAERRALIVERIIKFYSPKLSVENQQKMKSFFAILVRQFLKWGKQYAIHKEDLSALAKHLFTLAQETSETAGIVVRELLINLHKRLHSHKAVSKHPQLAELLLFKALIQIFPTSDLRHNVVSPLETLLSESLVRGSVDSPQDATHALFVCTLLLQMTKAKQRFTPEIIVCLKKLLRAFVVEDSQHWLRVDLQQWLESNESTAELPPLSLASASSVSGASVLHATLQLIDQMSAQYAFLPSFDELVYPLYLLLHELARSLFEGSHEQLNTVIANVHERLVACWQQREPLRLQTFGPSVLPTFMPKFDANYTLRKDKTMDRDKAKTKQLERQVKRARKNAARELRRDAAFLAREKQNEEQARVADKKEKQKEIWKWLEEQNATFNQQAKKGGNMLKGGGSGPAKKRRLPKN